MVLQIISIALPVLLVLFLGYLARVKQIVRDVSALKTLAVNFTLPFVLFGAYANAEYSATNLLVSAVVFALCVLALLVAYVLTRVTKLRFATAPYTATAWEAGMLGYPLFIMLFGAGATGFFAIPDMGQVLFVFTVYKLLLTRLQSEKVPGIVLLKQTVLSPVVIAMILGIVAGVSGVTRIPEVAMVTGSLVDFISAPTGVVILFAIGFEFSYKKSVLKSALCACAIRTLIMAMLAVVYCLVISAVAPGNDMLIYAGILLIILPPPYVLPVFSKDAQENAFASTTISIYTLMSIVFYIAFASYILSLPGGVTM